MTLHTAAAAAEDAAKLATSDGDQANALLARALADLALSLNRELQDINDKLRDLKSEVRRR